MIQLKSKGDIQKMREAGKILSACRNEIERMLKPGITLDEIDRLADRFITSHKAYPEQKGYCGYKYATCLSVNEVVCHGMPSKRRLEDGDIISVDMVVNLNGWLADSAWTFGIGRISPEAKKLMDVTKECMFRGIAMAQIGNRLGDVGNAIQTYAEENGFSVVRDYIGHGIGKEMHEEPEVPHVGRRGNGIRLCEGMVFTIEPMINAGDYRVRLSGDGWTVSTADGSLSAQYEHTIALTANGPIILTE